MLCEWEQVTNIMGFSQIYCKSIWAISGWRLLKAHLHHKGESKHACSIAMWFWQAIPFSGLPNRLECAKNTAGMVFKIALHQTTWFPGSMHFDGCENTHLC